jgi:Ca2+-binding EF-hand superfamily protein
MRIQTASVVLLGTLLSISSASFAKGGAGGSPAHAGAAGKSSVFTAIYDTDGDGTVTSAEVTAVRTVDFNAVDSDTSATLSLAEYQNLETNTQTREIKAMFKVLDTDLNSALSLTEFTANTTASTAVSNAFALADSDSNSALSLDEFTVLQGYKTGAIWGFAALDADASKTLTLAEFLAGRAGGNGGKR